MASSLPTVVNENLLQCPLCCRSVTQPNLLPCLHVFCRTCLSNHINKQRHAHIHTNSPNVAHNEPTSSLVDKTKSSVDDQATPGSRRKLKDLDARRRYVYDAVDETDDVNSKTGKLKDETKIIKRVSLGYGLPLAPPIPAATSKRSVGKTRLDENNGLYEEDGYEVPQDGHVDRDDTYEDVEINEDENQLYCNDDEIQAVTNVKMKSHATSIRRDKHSYVTMSDKAKIHKRPLAAKCSTDRFSAHISVSQAAAILGPLTSGWQTKTRQKSEVHDQSSTLSTIFQDDGLYENSEDDNIDDVMNRSDNFSDRKSRLVASARNLRRWKPVIETVGPPRLKRRNKAGTDTTHKDGGSRTTWFMPLPNRKSLPNQRRKRREDRDCGDVTVETVKDKMACQSKSNEEPLSITGNNSRNVAATYIYGDELPDKSTDTLGGDTLLGDTLGQEIPVYDVFKSATMDNKLQLTKKATSRTPLSSVTSDSYVQLEQRNSIVDEEAGRSATSGVYDVEQTVTDDTVDSPRHNTVERKQSVTLLDGDMFLCPVCEEPVRVATDDRQSEMDDADGGSRRNYGVTCPFIDAMLELVRLQTVDVRRCSKCNRSKMAEAYCLDCRRDLCSVCHDEEPHHHHVVDIRDLQAGRYQRELIKTGLPDIMCNVHCDRPAIGYCTVCCTTVCMDCCSNVTHQDHHIITTDSGELTVAAERERDLVTSTLLADVEQRLERLKTDADHIAAYRHDMETEKERAIQAVNTQKARLLAAVEQCHNELIESINEEFHYEQENIKDLTAALDKTVSRVDHAARFVRQVFELGRSLDVALMSSTIRQGLQAAAQVTPVTIDAKLTVDFWPCDDVTSARVSRLFGHMTIDRIPCIATADESDEYGDVSLNGSDVTKGERKSRRKKAASGGTGNRKTSICEPVLVTSFNARTTRDDKGCKPTGIAVVECDKDDDWKYLIVIVDDINKKLKIFDNSGTLQCEVKPEGTCRLVDPWDVAILSRSNSNDKLTASRYVVSDRGARDVKIFSESGQFVTSFGPHLTNPWGVATNSSCQILVTDTGRKTVFIHDAAGNQLFTVQGSTGPRYHLQCPEYVAVSPVNGDIIVTDFERHTVVYFDKTGRYLTEYSGDDDNEGEIRRRLKVPCGVAVSCKEDEGRVYVADYNNRRVVRLTRNGQYDTSFVSSSTASSLVNPQAVQFTPDGRLIVADRTNIKIFDVGIRRRRHSRHNRSKSAFNPVSTNTENEYLVMSRDQKQSTSMTSSRDVTSSANLGQIRDELSGQPVSSDDVSNTTKAAADAKKIKPRPLGPKPVLPHKPKLALHVSSMTSSVSKTSGGSSPTKTAQGNSEQASLLTSTMKQTPVSAVSDEEGKLNRSSLTLSYMETEVW